MSLSPQFLDELRARTSLSALVGRTVKLQRAGREWKACCPFHKEKTPSFYVNDEKGFWHCFGCGVHGDAIRWLTDARGLPFMDAVKELADAAGMEVPAADPRAQEKAERAAGLYDVMEAAQRWFEEQLGGLEGAEARAYLEKRGISEATRRRFGFGFAPDSRGKLRAALKDFGNDKLVEAGLLIAPDDEREPYDRFRGRLMFPIRDRRGRVIAFSARILGAGEPKYLNSPDTPLFDKGRTLFNIDKAAAASREAKRVIVVEGQMDVIALDQAGLGEAVAPLGTALTEAQLGLLWRLSPSPILCFDGDSAGQQGGGAGGAAGAAPCRPRPLARLRHPARRPGSRRPRPRRGPRGARRAAREARAARRPALEPRAGGRAAGHARAARRPQAPPQRPCRRDPGPARPRAISHRAARPLQRPDRAAAAAALDARPAAAAARAASSRSVPFRTRRRRSPAAAISPKTARSVLHGLLRYPELVAAHAEAIARPSLARQDGRPAARRAARRRRWRTASLIRSGFIPYWPRLASPLLPRGCAWNADWPSPSTAVMPTRNVLLAISFWSSTHWRPSRDYMPRSRRRPRGSRRKATKPPSRSSRGCGRRRDEAERQLAALIEGSAG